MQSSRVEIAREIHDGIAQDLVALGFQLDLVLAAPLTPAHVRNEIRTIRFTVSELIDKVRGEIYALRTPLEFNGKLQEIVYGISPTIEISGDELELSGANCDLLLRVIPELLRNAHTHSGASQILLELTSHKNGSMIKVIDNGQGGATATSGRYGIVGCIERIESHGGAITIDSRQHGTTITITV